MKSRITPYYTGLIYDACLKSFWRRKAMVKFLSQCGVADSFLSTWSKEESKRDLLDRLFQALPKTENGMKALVRMASFLAEQSSFPDLQNWEDSEVKIKTAHEAVGRLRRYHLEQEAALRSEEEGAAAREKYRETQLHAQQANLTIQKLNDRLAALAKEIGAQEAGYKFQDWFYDLADFFEVQNKRPYVSAGRQIDGALTIAGTTYLVELKFTNDQAGATDVDSIHKKVTGKADNTMGIMLSMSGYTQTAIKEASGARTPLLLLDYQHLYMVLGGAMSFPEVIDRVRRHASQTGEAYLAAADFGK